MFPLADARGRIVGFQARKLHEDDPLRGKYVNSPEGELFHKSAILYGLHLARTAIAKQERAVVVEGNTDVIALRQAGLEPVVASMGTALTERQLKELQRLTRRLYLCFDADAAGEEATLRGMELARRSGFDVRVVTLPKGRIPPTRRKASRSGSAGAESYVLYRVRLELERTPDRQEAFGAAARSAARTRTRPSGRRRCACWPTARPARRRRSPGLTPKGGGADAHRGSLAEAARRRASGWSGTRWRRASRIRRSSSCSPSSSPGALRRELHRRLRAHLVDGRRARRGALALRAELDARAAREGSTSDRQGAAAAPPRASAAPRARARRARQVEGAADALGRVQEAILGWLDRVRRRYNPPLPFPGSSIGRASGC